MSTSHGRRYVGEVHAILSEADTATPKQCLYHDRDGKRCRGEAIRSHSLQRSGPLASIAEDGHVVKVGPTLRAQPIEQRKLFERIGLGKASIFPGFCSTHDTELFSEIEGKDLRLTQRTGVVVAIRAMAMELFKKIQMVQIHEKLMSSPSVRDNPNKVEFASYIRSGARHATIENTRKIESLFRWYHKEPPSNFLIVGSRFEEPAPFASTGAFEPEWDFKKRSTYLVNPLKTKWNSIAFLNANVGRSFYSIYCGLQKYTNHRIDGFLNQLHSEGADLSSIFTLSLAFSENCYVRESWSNQLSREETSVISRLQMSGVLDTIRDPTFFGWRVPFTPNPVVERFRSWS